MAITTAIVSGIATVGSTAYAASQRPKPISAASLNPPSAGADQQKANSAALDAQQRARTKALSSQGQGSTILTGPQSVSTPPPARTTLLGL